MYKLSKFLQFDKSSVSIALSENASLPIFNEVKLEGNKTVFNCRHDLKAATPISKLSKFVHFDKSSVSITAHQNASLPIFSEVKLLGNSTLFNSRHEEKALSSMSKLSKFAQFDKSNVSIEDSANTNLPIFSDFKLSGNITSFNCLHKEKA